MHQVLDLTQYSSESDLDTNSFLTEFPLSKDPNSSGSEPSRELYADQVFCPFGQRNMYSLAHKESKMSDSKPAPKLNAMNLFAFRVSCSLPIRDSSFFQEDNFTNAFAGVPKQSF